MKKLFKILGISVGAIILIVAIGALFINFAPVPTYSYDPPHEYSIDMSPEQIAEGARIAQTMCVQCHKSPDGKLGGARLEDAPQFGNIHSANITQDPEYGINDYTTAQLAYLLRTGMKRNGEYAPPYMPKFPNLSDKDLSAIIAFLKSDNELVQPSHHPTVKPELSFLAKFLLRVAFKPLPYPDHKIDAPDITDRISLGKYLSTAKFDCYECHSKNFETNNPMVPENSVGFMAGGNPMRRLNGDLILTPNLTMDPETGLGEWTEQDFISAVKTGKRPFGKDATAFPMSPFVLLTDQEVSDIWAYLNTLKPTKNTKLVAEK